MDREGGGPNGQIVSIKRAADGKTHGTRKIIDKMREKYRAKNRFLRNTSSHSKPMTFVILINHTSAPIRKTRYSPTSRAKWETSRNKFVITGWVPDRVESFGESSSKKGSRARLDFAKAI